MPYNNDTQSLGSTLMSRMHKKIEETVDTVGVVQSYYNSFPDYEWERLGRHRNEFAITCRALQDHLPPAPARILDLGGGPGRYAIELTRRGYQVVLGDLSEANVHLAEQKAAEAGVKLEAALVVNALDLSAFSNISFDGALVMGPLYHLLNLEDRQQVVRETLRVLKPGGLLAGAFISRFAPFRDAAHKNMDWIFSDLDYTYHLLETGQHYNGDGFTRAYFAHPNEIEALFSDFDLQRIALVGVEGVVSENEELVNRLDGKAWEQWLEINYRIACDPAAVGAADHLLYLARKL
jgi:S-adenosylmethionine-dependent methyltransferase